MKTPSDLISRRLFNQQLIHSKFRRIVDLVAWMGGMQAQDYHWAKWAIGIRLKNITDRDVEQAIRDREIIRTWPMRGTLHFVSAEDVRWVLSLLAPPINPAGNSRLRELELDADIFKRSRKVLEKCLSGGKQLSRDEITAALEKDGISAKGPRLYHILYRAGREQLICFGKRRGKQFTYTLLDEWVPSSKKISRDESLCELTGRYFASRGPASVEDFSWWSGLSLTDARAGLEMAKRGLVREVVGGIEYWSSGGPALPEDIQPTIELMPAFEEYLLGYRDRSLVMNGAQPNEIVSTNGIFYPVITKNGIVAGTWRRSFKNKYVNIELNPFVAAANKLDSGDIRDAVGRYAGFLGLSPKLL